MTLLRRHAEDYRGRTKVRCKGKRCHKFRLVRPYKHYSLKGMHAAFQQFDANKDYRVTANELNAMFSRMDRNNSRSSADGFVSQDELLRATKRIFTSICEGEGAQGTHVMLSMHEDG